MSKFQALLFIVNTLIGQAAPGFANPDKVRLNEILQSISFITTDDWEAETLVKIAWWESGFKKEFVDCTNINKSGARGVFQVIPRNNTESLDACSMNYGIQTRLALNRIRESRKMCENKGFRGSDVLGGYTVGRCVNNEPLARVRFGDGTLLRSLINK
jgi:hypothetical protein